MLTPRAAQRAGHAREDASLPANKHGSHNELVSGWSIAKLGAGAELATGSVQKSLGQLSWVSVFAARIASLKRHVPLLGSNL